MSPASSFPTLGGLQLPVHRAAGTRGAAPPGLRAKGAGSSAGARYWVWRAGTLCPPAVCLGPPHAASQMPGKGPRRLHAPSLAPLRAQQTEHKWHLGSRGSPSLLPPTRGPYKSPWLRLAKGQEPRGEGGRDGRQLQRGTDGGGASGKEHPSPSPRSRCGAEHQPPSPAPRRQLSRVLPCVPRGTRPPPACPAYPTSSSAS